MTWFRFVAAISLLFVPFASSMSAEREQFRIRSAFVGAAGEVSAVVELPPGSTPKSTDFKLLINDRVAATARETQDQRLNLMFLVDVSGSMKGQRLNDAKNALVSLLAKARPQDQFSLTSFADEDRLQSSFAEPREKLNGALRNLRVEGKRTKLYQALYNALKKGPKDDPQTRQIIVVVSNGKDEGSDVSLEQVITESKAMLVPIYAVFRGEIDRSFADALAGLANAAGGNFFSTRNRDEFASALEQIYRSETNSLAVRFVYQADPAGDATENAVIELRQPDGFALRAKFPEKIPALFIAPPPSLFPLWQIGYFLAVPLGGAALWVWRRAREKVSVRTIPSTVEIETESPTEFPSPPPPPQRATKVAGESEKVEFAVFAPAGITPNSSFVLDVWAYSRHQYSSMIELTKEVGREINVGSKSGVSVIRGTILTIQIDIVGLEVPEPVDTVVWDGVPANASFIINVPPETKIGMYRGKASIGYQGITIVKVAFVVSVTHYDHRDYIDRSDRPIYPRTAFASYASENREEVLSRVQGMRKIAPDLEIFVDVFSLRSGQNWQDKLEEHVPKKDIFYLFWSQAAARSEWVGREWKLALNRRGLNYIDPVPLEEPDRAPPPQELAALHFSDAYLVYIAYERLKREMENRGQR
jgi:von Willebrand factor type A domain/TIR domain